ncbi:MAG TPA: hypothetical protein VG895_02150 [Patescibacteria group bacterium]|nr:hypothetical protein [Patescibacteria group bacterium]
MKNFQSKYFFISLFFSILFFLSIFTYNFEENIHNFNFSLYGLLSSIFVASPIAGFIFLLIGIKNNLKKNLKRKEIIIVVLTFVLLIIPILALLLLILLAAMGFGPPS